MGAGRRLSFYLESKGITKKNFCESNSIDYNNFTSILADSRSIGINVLNKIHEALPKLNVHWVLYNEGKMEIEENFENLVKKLYLLFIS